MPTLLQAITTYCKVDRSERTNLTYLRTLTRLATAIGPARDVRRISYEDLLDYFAQIKPTLKQTSFVNYLRITKTFFRWCVQVHYLKTDPSAGLTARKPQKDPTISRAIPAETLDRMLDTATSYRTYARNAALVAFIAATACRIGAAAGLRLSRLNLDGGEAIVIEKGGVFVPVYFDQGTADLLKDWLRERPSTSHDFVFVSLQGPTWGQPLKVASAAAVVRRLSEKCGGRAYGPHSLRHLAADYWKEEGLSQVDIQHKLNHKHLRTTENYLPQNSKRTHNLSRRLTLSNLRKKRQPDAQPAPDNILFLDDCG